MSMGAHTGRQMKPVLLAFLSKVESTYAEFFTDVREYKFEFEELYTYVLGKEASIFFKLDIFLFSLEQHREAIKVMLKTIDEIGKDWLSVSKRISLARTFAIHRGEQCMYCEAALGEDEP